MGTTEISFLCNTLNAATAICREHHIPFKSFTDVRQMHLNTMFVLICLKVHVCELSRLCQFGDSFTPYEHAAEMEPWLAYFRRLSTDFLEASRTLCTSTVHTRLDKRGERVLV